MKEKNECIKTINDCIEKILNDFILLFEYLKVKQETKNSELESLLFSKKKMIEITESIEIIFQNLVFLKHIYRNSTLLHKKEKAPIGFDYLKEYYNCKLNINN